MCFGKQVSEPTAITAFTGMVRICGVKRQTTMKSGEKSGVFGTDNCFTVLGVKNKVYFVSYTGNNSKSILKPPWKLFNVLKVLYKMKTIHFQ